MVPMFAAIVIIYEFLARWVGFKSFETWIMNGKTKSYSRFGLSNIYYSSSIIVHHLSLLFSKLSTEHVTIFS